MLDPGDDDDFTYVWSVTDDSNLNWSYTTTGSSSTFTFDPTTDGDLANNPTDYVVHVSVTGEHGDTGGDNAWLDYTDNNTDNNYGPSDVTFVPDSPTVSIQQCDANGNPTSASVLAGTNAYFLVTVSGNMPNHGPITVYYHTVDGTAHAVTDYTPSDGDQALTLTWDSSAGCYDSEITHGPAIITVDTTPVADDGSGETFSVVVKRTGSHPRICPVR